jgi:hypothetical protein
MEKDSLLNQALNECKAIGKIAHEVISIEYKDKGYVDDKGVFRLILQIQPNLQCKGGNDKKH